MEKKDLRPWLDGLTGSHTLVAPKRVDDLVLFRPVASSAEIVFDVLNTDVSPREFFFPKTETLFTAEPAEGGPKLVPNTVEKDTVLFGIRPCDARGIALLDGPFLSPPADAMWSQHRAKTTMVGVTCLQPGPQCFCTSVGTAPDDATNVDILLTEVPEGWAVDVKTPKGEKLIQGLNLREVPGRPEPVALEKKYPSEGVEEALRANFDSPYWADLAERCIHCNVCSYVCPSCYCFDIRDRTEGGKTERFRTWESCQSKGFTRIAGGHDPRAEKGSRLRQRFAHKLLYFPKEFGAVSCVGCGRCVVACPVNIDIREVIVDVKKQGGKTRAAGG